MKKNLFNFLIAFSIVIILICCNYGVYTYFDTGNLRYTQKHRIMGIEVSDRMLPATAIAFFSGSKGMPNKGIKLDITNDPDFYIQEQSISQLLLNDYPHNTKVDIVKAFIGAVTNNTQEKRQEAFEGIMMQYLPHAIRSTEVSEPDEAGITQGHR